MTKLSHRQIIKDYLTEHKGEWVNKLKLEQLARADDARPRIWDIRHKDGFQIIERTSPQNGLAEYMYVGIPVVKKQEPIAEYVFIGNKAYKKEDLEPRQEVLI